MLNMKCMFECYTIFLISIAHYLMLNMKCMFECYTSFLISIAHYLMLNMKCMFECYTSFLISIAHYLMLNMKCMFECYTIFLISIAHYLMLNMKCMFECYPIFAGLWRIPELHVHFNLLQYLLTINLSKCDILDVFSGIHYQPLEKNMHLQVQCLINRLELSAFPLIKYTLFLYNDKLVW